MSSNDENLKDEIVKLISKGDNDRVEFRHHSGGPNLLGKIMSSFANASGGKLILGVNKKGKIIGCNKEDIMETFNKSKEKLIPCPIVSIEFIEINKKVLAIISIEKTEKIISSSLGVFKRANNSEEIMVTEEIKSKQLNAVTKDTIGEMAQQISQLTITLEDTIQRYRRQNKLSRKIIEWIACGIIGIILSILINL